MIETVECEACRGRGDQDCEACGGTGGIDMDGSLTCVDLFPLPELERNNGKCERCAEAPHPRGCPCGDCATEWLQWNPR